MESEKGRMGRKTGGDWNRRGDGDGWELIR